ncbi:MAG: helix-turn-helix domain-containing protein [Chloroflexi bacterium]|nr:helix-turn-helix domain-containing protein [Chloroflexota bacterium]
MKGNRNAKLTCVSRLGLVQQVEPGRPRAEVARQFRFSRPAVAKYVRRHRAQRESGLIDRCSRPRSKRSLDID